MRIKSILERIFGKKGKFLPIGRKRKFFPIVEENNEVKRLMRLRQQGIWGNGQAMTL